MKTLFHILSLIAMVLVSVNSTAQTADSLYATLQSDSILSEVEAIVAIGEGAADSTISPAAKPVIATFDPETGDRLTLYDYPYSQTLSIPDWKRMWLNTGILMTAGVTTMFVLESLPSDATAWNKTENGKVPLFKRWWQNVHKGPVWDKDNIVFDYVLHPYAGAAYYMGARSNGFNMWGSFVYSFCISTFFWEYGFEAFNEIPSVQDLIITPVVGTILGEGFYLVKRHIVSNGYRLWGSKILGYAVAFLVDPINEVTGYFRSDQRKLARRAENRRAEKVRGSKANVSSWLAPSRHGLQGGISLTYTF